MTPPFEIKELASDRVFNEMRSATENMRPGTKLPSERELMENHDISRQAARSVLNRLTQAGLVERKIGSGTFVKDRNETREQANSLIEVNAGLVDILEARRGLDPLVVELATERASPREILRMQSIMDKLTASYDQADLKRHSYDFLMALAEATRNPLLQFTYKTLVQCRENIGWEQLQWQQEGEDFRLAVIARQTELFEAIKKRDRYTAVSLVLKDLERMRVQAMGPRVQQSTPPLGSTTDHA